MRDSDCYTTLFTFFTIEKKQLELPAGDSSLGTCKDHALWVQQPNSPEQSLCLGTHLILVKMIVPN
jgi:hypothetical protein